ncbi:hypothetical protein B0H11DRAFT_1875547 [Mycena galericulata]|nr:hypothetical protein B0H11DRAFT_1875547 [Mycena galericulata]
MSSPTASSPASGNPYAPQEPANVLWLEHASFAGNNLGEICYGITLVLFFQCLRALTKPRTGSSHNLRNWFLIGYVIVMFGLGTIFTAMNMHLMQISYIDNRNFPEGPIGYSLAMYSTWRVTVPNACSLIANWLADGLLIYRCYILYNMTPMVLIAPGIMYLASISMGAIVLYKSSRPGSSLWSGVTVNFGLPYFTIACSLNIFLTILIAGRLFYHSRSFSKINPDSKSPTLYSSIIAMMVESCAIYAVTSLLFIGPYAANNYASDIFLPLLSQVQIIGPFLIILRVANQQAATATSTLGSAQSMSFRVARSDQSTVAVESTMEFALKPTGNSTGDVKYNSTVDISPYA